MRSQISKSRDIGNETGPLHPEALLNIFEYHPQEKVENSLWPEPRAYKNA